MSKIRVCSMCGNLGAMAEATDEQAYRVLTVAKVDMRATRNKWRVRVWVCSACETPLIELYPELMSQSSRRALLGINDEPLTISEEGNRSCET
jgi:hypothetical protein